MDAAFAVAATLTPEMGIKRNRHKNWAPGGFNVAGNEVAGSIDNESCQMTISKSVIASADYVTSR